MLILCLKIFFARILDVTLGTIKSVSVIKGHNFMAGLLAFFEIFIWFLVAREALNTEITSIFIPLAYSAGYACGTFIGTTITEKCISGFVSVQIISSLITEENIEKIRKNGYAISKIKLDHEDDKDKKMLFIETKKAKLKTLIKFIEEIDKNAFIVINETKTVNNGFIK